MSDNDDDDGFDSYSSISVTSSLPFPDFSSTTFSLPGLSRLQESSNAAALSSTKASKATNSQTRFPSSSSSSSSSLYAKVDGKKSRLMTSEVSLPPSSTTSSCSSSFSQSNKLSSGKSTHGSLLYSENNLTPDGEEAWICSIAESRGVGKEVGVALFESSTNRCILTQASTVYIG